MNRHIEWNNAGLLNTSPFSALTPFLCLYLPVIMPGKALKLGAQSLCFLSKAASPAAVEWFLSIVIEISQKRWRAEQEEVEDWFLWIP